MYGVNACHRTSRTASSRLLLRHIVVTIELGTGLTHTYRSTEFSLPTKSRLYSSATLLSTRTRKSRNPEKNNGTPRRSLTVPSCGGTGMWSTSLSSWERDPIGRIGRVRGNCLLAIHPSFRSSQCPQQGREACRWVGRDLGFRTVPSGGPCFGIA